MNSSRLTSSQRLSTATRRRRSRAGFTLIEILMAAIAGALILGSIYTVFTRAVQLRNNATERTREAQLRARAATVLRNDLQNGLVSGGIIAATLEGSRNSQGSQFPGYLRFTTTTARNADAEIAGDVHEVEYYIANDQAATDRNVGVLVRAVNHNLLGSLQAVAHEELLLPGVESMEVSFYDGDSWADSWEVNESDNTVPKAIRVRIQPHIAAEKHQPTVPIEVVVPWTTQPLTSASSEDSSSTGGSSTGTGTGGTSGGGGTGTTPPPGGTTP